MQPLSSFFVDVGLWQKCSHTLSLALAGASTASHSACAVVTFRSADAVSETPCNTVDWDAAVDADRTKLSPSLTVQDCGMTDCLQDGPSVALDRGIDRMVV